MYLSRIELDTNKRETMRALSSPQVFHAAVENCYPDFPKGGALRRLYRIDRLGGRLYLLLLSPISPALRRNSVVRIFRESQSHTTRFFPRSAPGSDGNSD
jgi:hypothetical protein